MSNQQGREKGFLLAGLSVLLCYMLHTLKSIETAVKQNTPPQPKSGAASAPFFMPPPPRKGRTRKHTQLTLALAQEKEHRANTLQLAKALVHELKSPVHQLRLANEHKLQQRKKQDPLLSYNIKQTGKILSDINEILTQLDSQGAKTPAKSEQFDLIALIHEVASGFTVHMEKRALSFCLESEEICQIQSSKGTLRLLLHNMLSNMVQYATKGSELSLSVEQAGASLYIQSSNRSSQTNIQRMKHALGPFQLAPKKSEEHLYSSGNGLFLIKDLVALLNGSYQLHTKGDTVQIALILPLA